MTIAATRFTSLDKEFDTAMVSISSSDPRQIMNASFNTVTDLSTSLVDSINRIAGKLNIRNVISEIKGAKSKLEAAVGLTKALSAIRNVTDAIRRVRGIVKSTLDSSKFGSKDLDRYISEIFGSDTRALNLFKGMSSSYRDSVLSNITLGKPFDKTILTPNAIPGSAQNFTLGEQTFDYTAISGIVQQVSGQGYDVTTTDNNMLLKKVTMIANLGYDANLPGVMKTMMNTPGLNEQVKNRAIAIVMTEQANKGNVSAILDMTDSTSGVISGSNSPLSFNPSIVTDLMSNLQIPNGTKENDLTLISDTLLTSMDTLDPNWRTSDDNLVSTKQLENVSPDLNKAMRSKANGNVITEADLDVTFDSPDNILASAMVGFDSSKLAEIYRLGRNNSCSKICCNC